MAKSSNVMQNTGDAEIHPPLPPVLNADCMVEKLRQLRNRAIWQLAHQVLRSSNSASVKSKSKDRI